MFMVPNTISEFIGYNFTKPNYNCSMKSEKNSVMKRMRVEKEKKGNMVKIVNSPNTMSWFKWKAKNTW
jgi:hypothetical protein